MSNDTAGLSAIVLLLIIVVQALLSNNNNNNCHAFVTNNRLAKKQAHPGFVRARVVQKKIASAVPATIRVHVALSLQQRRRGAAAETTDNDNNDSNGVSSNHGTRSTTRCNRQRKAQNNNNYHRKFTMSKTMKRSKNKFRPITLFYFLLIQKKKFHAVIINHNKDSNIMRLINRNTTNDDGGNIVTKQNYNFLLVDRIRMGLYKTITLVPNQIILKTIYYYYGVIMTIIKRTFYTMTKNQTLLSFIKFINPFYHQLMMTQQRKNNNPSTAASSITTTATCNDKKNTLKTMPLNSYQQNNKNDYKNNIINNDYNKKVHSQVVHNYNRNIQCYNRQHHPQSSSLWVQQSLHHIKETDRIISNLKQKEYEQQQQYQKEKECTWVKAILKNNELELEKVALMKQKEKMEKVKIEKWMENIEKQRGLDFI